MRGRQQWSDHPTEVPIATDVGRRPGRYVGPVSLGLAFACITVTALLGPNAAEAPLGQRDDPATPPWHLAVSPSPWLVCGLLVAAVVLGCLAVAWGMTGRWRPQPRRLLATGIVAAGVLAFLPPIGSADPLSYAAYGRMVATGHDPWSTTPRQIAAAGDPVGRAVEVPWQNTPSVYGPLATAEQGAASAVAGDDVAVTVLLLDIAGAVAFVAAGLLLHLIAADDQRRRRAAVLWTANPLLWLQLLAGAHLDVLAAAFALSAVALAGRSRIAAGAAAGAAACVKAPAALVWLALVWARRTNRRAVLEVTGAAAVVVGVGYGVAGAGAVHQLSRASRLVSLGTTWRWVADLTDPALGHGASRRLIGVLAVLLFAGLVVALARSRTTAELARPATVAVTVTAAYVLAAPYALPWYDAVPWVLLPLVALSRLDWWLLAHTGVLSLAYIPGRKAAILTDPLRELMSGMRTVMSPLLLSTLLALVILCGLWERSRPPAWKKR